MPAGSVGKTFTAAVAISLVHEGKLNLDDKIETWLGKEDWFGRLPNGKDITLRMLLNHSSGLRDHVFEQNFREAIHERLNKPDPDLDFVFSPRELVAFVLNTEPLFAAGKAWKYTDTVFHSFLSILHSLFRKYDVILICNAANSIFASVLPGLANTR